MKIKIEEAKRKDLNSILKLQMELADYHREIDGKYYLSGKERKDWFRKTFSKNFGKKNQKFLVAKVGKQVVGLMSGRIEKAKPYCREPKIGKISQACVTEKYRRKGIGRMLFKKMLEWFKEKKIKFVEVSVDSRNKIGISAWKKFGFFEFQKKMRLDL